jgi:hypothetical protein
VLCANNRTYHRELPAELGETGEELPEDEGVRLLYLLTHYMCSLRSHTRHRAKAILLAGGGVRPLGGRGVRKTEGNTQGAVRTHSIRITQANT